MSTYYERCQYLVSAAGMQQIPPDEGYEVVFSGRSNAGKSSVINAICRNKNLARTSRTPGRTQLLNFFRLDCMRRLVDLPGYGFAQVPQQQRDGWEEMIGNYLQHRRCLRGMVVVMDARNAMTEHDLRMLTWARHAQLPIHVLLNKSDKLGLDAAHNTLNQVQSQLGFDGSVQLFSVPKRYGVKTAHKHLTNWLKIDTR